MRRAVLIAVAVVAAVLPLLHAVRPAGAACAPRTTLLAHGLQAPDDIAIDGRRVLFTDEPRGILAAFSAGAIRVLARGLRGPEGIVVRDHRHIVVAEQEANRVSAIDLPSGRRSTLLSLPNATGRLGIDGLAAAPAGGLYIPDSPNGRLLLLNHAGRLTVLAAGLGRPVGAVRFGGGIAVADETAHAVWEVRGGHFTRLATVPTPDDVVVFAGALLAVTLDDGGLWEIAPIRRLLLGRLGEPQGLAVSENDLVVADSRSNALYRVSGIRSCLSS